MILTMLRRLAVVVVSVWMAGTGIAEAKSYSAERFDSRIRVVDGGALEVTETVTFRFESGTFSRVFRDIPRRRTDGIEILRASMDGRPFPFGTDPNQASIRVRSSRVRVEWRFDPVTTSTHTFELVYRARGVVQQRDGEDYLAWRALPSEHDYTIDSARVDVILPENVTAAFDVAE